MLYKDITKSWDTFENIVQGCGKLLHIDAHCMIFHRHFGMESVPDPYISLAAKLRFSQKEDTCQYSYYSVSKM